MTAHIQDYTCAPRVGGVGTRRCGAVSPSLLAATALLACTLVPLLPGMAHAGACQDQARSYCILNNSTGSDWTWEVDGVGGTVDASAHGLTSGDPAQDIAAVFSSVLSGAGITNSIVTPSSCFTMTSCTRLSIDGTLVDPVGVNFNPLIVQIVPEPGVSAMWTCWLARPPTRSFRGSRMTAMATSGRKS